MAERAEGLVRRIPWIAGTLLLGIPAGLMALHLLEAAGLQLPPCLFKQSTGLPCATCGLTRMTQALAAGDFPAAWHWHPVATMVVALSPLAVIWDLCRAWRGDEFPALPDTGWARAAVVGLFVATWLLQILRGI